MTEHTMTQSVVCIEQGLTLNWKLNAAAGMIQLVRITNDVMCVLRFGCLANCIYISLLHQQLADSTHVSYLIAVLE